VQLPPPEPTCDAGPWLLESGVDWLTATSADPAVCDRLRHVCGRALRQEVDAGADLRSWSWNSYHGYTAGQVAIGARHDGTIVRLSGAAAAGWWSWVTDAGARPSRLDVQATVSGVPAGFDLASWHERQAAESGPRNGRPISRQLVLQDGTGQTLYLGRRQSDCFARVYDKHSEQPRSYPAGCWRYELEYKRSFAVAVAEELRGHATAYDAVRSLVWSWFSGHGVVPVYRNDASPIRVTVQRSETDDARRLAYLRSVLLPMCERLAKHGQLVVEPEVLLALQQGLQLQASPGREAPAQPVVDP
jgi:DNA relaxase NicK